MILAGDVGGTKTNLGLFEERNGELCEVGSRRLESTAYPSLGALVVEFLDGNGDKIERAAFGVAGPVVRGKAQATNLPWLMDARALEKQIRVKPVLLINDLVATAAGLLDLPEKSLHTLYKGKPHERGTRAVLAPGTGLGQAGLIWDGKTYHPLPSEGGHADFAPRTDDEIELLRHLLTKQERVSYEDVLAGPGISRIYDFLRDTGKEKEPAELAQELARATDRNAAISRLGLTGESRICTQTLLLWTGILGAEASNLALRALSIGGVYLGGGIVVKLLAALEKGPFVKAFLSKGRLSDLIQKIPVRVVLDDRAALKGAARMALETR